jgi:uncharacterized protein (DUF58 family)
MSVPQSERSTTQIGGWLELASLTSGLFLVWLAYRQWAPDNGEPTAPMAILWFALGMLLALWGVRNVAIVAVEWLGWLLRPRGSRRYHVSFRREAYIYMMILLVICVGAILGGSNLLLLVFGLMAGPFVFGGQVTRMVLQRLRIARSLPDCAVAGQRFAVRVRLANQKSLLSAWMIVAADTVSNAHEEVKPKVLFTRVPPHSEREAMYAICPARRGRYRFGPMRVICGFPLGLVERSFGLGETQELLVYPRIGRLSTGWHATVRQGRQSSERALARIGVTSEEFHRLREYRGGDNPRAIHWRTTARRNELMVREYQHLRNPDLTLVLDLWQPDRPTQLDLERVERAVSFAATICAEHAQASGEAHLQLTICGRNVWTSTGSTQGQMLRPLLEQLALAEAGPARQLADALSEANRANTDQMRRVLISTRPSLDALSTTQSETSTGGAASLSSDYQIIHSDADELAEFVAYDEPPKGVTA